MKKASVDFIVFAALLLLLEMLVFRDFLFGEAFFVFKDLGSDSYVNEYPLLHLRMQHYRAGTLPGWSFSNGLGENLFPYSFDPVCWLLTVTTGISAESMMLVFTMSYVFLAGMMMYCFLGEHRLHPRARMFGGLAWAFSGYALLAGSWCPPLFAPHPFHLSLLLFAAERAVARRQYGWLALAFALIGFSYPFNLYFAVVVVGLYGIAARYRSGMRASEFLKRSGYAAVFSLLGTGLSCWMLLSSVHLMKNSPRGAGMVAGFEQGNALFAGGGEILSSLYRLFSPNLLGDAAHFRLYRNYFEAPMLYCGIFTVLLLSQLRGAFGHRGRKIALAALLLLLLIYLIPGLRWMVWLRSGDYYRTLNLIAAMTMIVCSSFALSALLQAVRISPRPLMITAGVILIVLIGGAAGLPVEGQSSFLTPAAFVVVASVLLYFLHRFPAGRGGIAVVALLAVELLTVSGQTINDRLSCTSVDLMKRGYRDKASATIAAINEKDPSFFRLEKDFYSGIALLSSYNEAKVQGHRASAAYNSFNSAHYIRFLQTMDLSRRGNEEDSRFVPGIRSSPLLMKLCTVKYFLAAGNSDDSLLRYGFRVAGDNSSYRTLEDSAVLPFGICYDELMGEHDFGKLSKAEKAATAFKTLCVPEHALKHFPEVRLRTDPTVPSDSALPAVFQRLRRTGFALTSFSDNAITGSITAVKPQALFFSMPYDEGWSILDNGKSASFYPAFGGLMAMPLSSGAHRIELRYQPPLKQEGTIVSLISAAMLTGMLFLVRRNRKKATRPSSSTHE